MVRRVRRLYELRRNSLYGVVSRRGVRVKVSVCRACLCIGGQRIGGAAAFMRLYIALKVLLLSPAPPGQKIAAVVGDVGRVSVG